MKEEKRKGRGRPRKQYDSRIAEMVQDYAQYGVPQEAIAAKAGMCVETLLNIYGDNYRTGTSEANYKVGKKLYEKCENGDTTALIFWAKTRMGWRETQRIEHSGQLSGEVVIFKVPDNERD